MWDVQAVPFHPSRDGLPEAQARWLILAVHAINEARKYFLVSAPPEGVSVDSGGRL